MKRILSLEVKLPNLHGWQIHAKRGKMILLGISMFGLADCSLPENRQIPPDSKQQLEAGSKLNVTEKNTLEKAQPSDENDSETRESEGTEAAGGVEDLLNPEGMTLETRVRTPGGYMRMPAEEGSFAAFLRNYSMKEADSPVLLYNGREKGNQGAHAAVFTLPIESEDLQQCADSVMRVYAEYFYQTGQYDRIAFHFVNGFWAEYSKWRDGYRIVVDGNDVSWSNSAEADDSYENFQEYMRMVFAYAGTLSMKEEAHEITLDEIQAGDVFLKGGSPGHVVMIVDVCEKEDGSKAFLLGQGYMPAQEFHLLKNPKHGEDPWYYEEEVNYPFSTPEYTFLEGSLCRLDY